MQHCSSRNQSLYSSSEKVEKEAFNTVKCSTILGGVSESWIAIECIGLSSTVSKPQKTKKRMRKRKAKMEKKNIKTGTPIQVVLGRGTSNIVADLAAYLDENFVANWDQQIRKLKQKKQKGSAKKWNNQQRDNWEESYTTSESHEKRRVKLTSRFTLHRDAILLPPERLYCLCRCPEDFTQAVECVLCKEWFHTRCM